MIRLYTPGTPENACRHAGVHVSGKPPGVIVMRNPRGFFATGDGVWAGYFDSAKKATAAIELLANIEPSPPVAGWML